MRKSHRTTQIPTIPKPYDCQVDVVDHAVPGDIYLTASGELVQAIQVDWDKAETSCEGCMWNSSLCVGRFQDVPPCTATPGTVIYVPAPKWDEIEHTTVRVYDDGTWAYTDEVNETGNDETVDYYEERVPVFESDEATQAWLNDRGHWKITHK